MNLFDLFAKITLDTSEYEKGLSDSEAKTKGFVSGISGGIGNVVKAVGKGITKAVKSVGVLAVAGGTAAAGVAKKATDAYADFEQLAGGVETLFKDSSDVVMKYAQDAYKTAGLSANEYMETVTSFSASLLQSVGGDTKKAAEIADMAIRDMSDNANKMGTDMGLIQNAYQGFAKQNYTMLDNLKLGYGGTKEEMLRLVSDAQKLDSSFKANTETVIKNKKKTEELAPTYADIVQAIHIMQNEMGVTGTTALEAEKTISGSAATMKSAWDNLLVSLASGENISENLMQVAGSAKTYLSNIVPVFVQSIKSIGPAIKEIVPVIVGELPGIVSDIIPSVLSAGLDIITALAQGVVDNSGQLLDGVSKVIDLFVSFLNDSAPTLIQAGADIIMTLVTGIVNNLPQLVKSGLEIIVSLADSISKSLPELIPTIVDVILEIVEVLTDPENLEMLIEAALKIIIALAEGIIKAIPKLLEAAVKLMEKFTEGIVKAIVNVAEAGKKVVTGFVDGVKSWFNQVKDSGKQIVDRVKDGIMGAFDAFKQAVSDKFATIKEAITRPFESAYEWVKGVVDKLKNIFNFEWSLPKIKLPHFKVRPYGWKFGDLLKGSIPSLSIEWYKKAYDEPYLFEKPTVVSARGFGDGNGSEFVYGRDNLMRDIREAVGSPTVTFNIYQRAGEDSMALARRIEQDLIRLERDRKVGALA